MPDSLPSIGALGQLTGDRHNPTGWLEPVTKAAEDVLMWYEERAYDCDGLRLYLDRRTWDEAFDALEAEGIGVVDPGNGVIIAVN